MNALNRSLSALACHVRPWCFETYHHLLAHSSERAHHHEEKTLWAELAHERHLENELWLVLAVAGLGAIAAAYVLG